MSTSGLSVFFLIILLLGVVFLLHWVWRRPIPTGSSPPILSESSDSEVTPRALMTAEEATLFNLIRLAAQDYFLVLVKLPVLQVVLVQDTDELARKTLMRTIQSVRLDVVLVHPGSLQTETVVHFQKDEESKQVETRDQVVETVLKAAGIKVVELRLDQSYSVEQVMAKLGLEEEE